MIKKSNKGFTLIELLVVIAIIGILSAVVLASLNTARNKGKAASAVGSMTSMRAQAEIYNSNGSYPSSLCTASTGELAALRKAVETQTSKTLTCAIKSDNSAWAASIDMTGVGGTSTSAYFCVDSAGFAGYRATSGVVSSSTCPTS
jgi:type IV pilus assembly protein PilA